MIFINQTIYKLKKYRAQLDSAFSRVLDNGVLVLGDECLRFEGAFADYLGVTRVVGVANATDALLIGMRALKRLFGVTRCATVANAGFYSSAAAVNSGLELMYMDVDIDNQLVTLDSVKLAIQSGADVVVATHLFGQAIPEIAAIAEYCKTNGVKLIEDCSQAHGAVVGMEKVGSFGDLSCFSFYPTKNLGTLGDGGAVATNNDSIAGTIEALRQYGWGEKYRVDISGGVNSRLDEIQAAFLNELLPYLDDMNSNRRAIASRYSQEIVTDVKLPPVMGGNYVAHLYVLQCSKRDNLREFLTRNGVGTAVHYPVPDHKQAVWGGRFDSCSLPNTEHLANTILTLPCYSELAMDSVSKVIEILNAWE